MSRSAANRAVRRGTPVKRLDRSQGSTTRIRRGCAHNASAARGAHAIRGFSSSSLSSLELSDTKVYESCAIRGFCQPVDWTSELGKLVQPCGLVVAGRIQQGSPHQATMDCQATEAPTLFVTGFDDSDATWVRAQRIRGSGGKGTQGRSAEREGTSAPSLTHWNATEILDSEPQPPTLL